LFFALLSLCLIIIASREENDYVVAAHRKRCRFFRLIKDDQRQRCTCMHMIDPWLVKRYGQESPCEVKATQVYIRSVKVQVEYLQSISSINYHQNIYSFFSGIHEFLSAKSPGFEPRSSVKRKDYYSRNYKSIKSRFHKSYMVC
jgi:hypothetical protein